MAVKHVGAPKAPGLAASNPRRLVNTAAARPPQKVPVAPGEIKAASESELAVARALLDEIPPDNAVPVENRVPESSSSAITPDPAAASRNAAVDYYAILT